MSLTRNISAYPGANEIAAVQTGDVQELRDPKHYRVGLVALNRRSRCKRPARGIFADALGREGFAGLFNKGIRPRQPLAMKSQAALSPSVEACSACSCAFSANCWYVSLCASPSTPAIVASRIREQPQKRPHFGSLSLREDHCAAVLAVTKNHNPPTRVTASHVRGRLSG